MTATIAQQYIADQIEVFERINESFPKVNICDDFLAYDARNSVWDTLCTLREVKGEIKHAQSESEVMAALEDLREEYQAGEIPGCACCIENVQRVIYGIISAVKDLYHPVEG